MSSKNRRQNIRKYNDLLLWILEATELRFSELKLVEFVSADTDLNQITLFHPPSNRTFNLQAKSAQGPLVEYIKEAWKDSHDLV